MFNHRMNMQEKPQKGMLNLLYVISLARSRTLLPGLYGQGCRAI